MGDNVGSFDFDEQRVDRLLNGEMEGLEVLGFGKLIIM